MADMSMVVTLAGEGKSYAGTMESASRSTAKLNSDLDKLTAAMEAELAGEAAATNQKRILEAADKGASAAKAEYALRLADELDSLRALQAAEAREAEVKARNRQVSQDLVAAVRLEGATYGMTASEIRIYTAAQNGASEASIRQARQVETATGTMQRYDRQIQKQIESQRAAHAATQRQGNGQMALIESTRGLEDAVVGYSTNGLKGMVTATANNVAQIGALIGGNAALYLGLGGVAALIATSLLPKILDWASGMAKVREETLKLEDASEKFHNEEMKRIDQRYKATWGRDKEGRQSSKLLGGDGTAKQLQAEADRLREEIEADKERTILERRKQAEISRASPLSHLEANPYEKRKAQTVGEYLVGGGYAGAAVDWTASWFSDGERDDPEIRKKQSERWEADRKAMQASREAQKEAARDQDLHQQLLQKTEAAARERAKLERKQEIDEMVDKEREKNQKSHDDRAKQAADLADKEQKFQADMLAKGFALEAKAADDARKMQAAKLSTELASKKKSLADQTSGGGNDLSAVEANSSEGFKRVYDATRGGGAANPNAQVAENTAKMLAQMKLDAERAERELDAIKKLGGLKTGPA